MNKHVNLFKGFTWDFFNLNFFFFLSFFLYFIKMSQQHSAMSITQLINEEMDPDVKMAVEALGDMSRSKGNSYLSITVNSLFFSSSHHTTTTFNSFFYHNHFTFTYTYQHFHSTSILSTRE
jgi:hypothetical protein